ncbi:MAG: MATE family efflux transporter [Flavobacteriaceae bacterium]|nr:MATE family efflux transporter [Flavobacteriaceae bacterium]
MLLSLNLKHTKDCFKLALPVMLTQLGQVSVNLFDNMMVGNILGADALASTALANAVFFSLYIFAVGFSFAIPPLVSEAQAQDNHQKINSVFRHGLVVNLAIGIVLSLILLGIAPLMHYAKQPPQIIPNAILYLNIITLSIIPVMIFQTLREVSEGLSYTIGVTIATIMANVINIALNYIFMVGLFGIEPMGISGAAYATLISRVFSMLFLYLVMAHHKTTKRYIQEFSLKIQLFERKMFQNLVKLGLPTALQLFFEVTAFALASFICGLVSATDIAAHQVTISMASFTFNLCAGFGVASTIMIGKKRGEKDFVAAKEIGINNLKIAFLFMSLCCLGFILGKDFLPTLFTKPNELAVAHLASQLLVIASLFQLSDGLQVVALGCLRGIQDVKIPSIITFIAYWGITLPLGYFLCVEQKMGAYGMWIGFGLGLTFSAIFLVRRFILISKRQVKS